MTYDFPANIAAGVGEKVSIIGADVPTGAFVIPAYQAGSAPIDGFAFRPAINDAGTSAAATSPQAR